MMSQVNSHSQSLCEIVTLVAVAAAISLVPLSVAAAPVAFDLSAYSLTGTFVLPSVSAAEASAVTYNWDRDSLFVLGDEGDALVEVSKTGVQLGIMTLTGFDDTEGLTYIGNGEFVLTEERLRDAYRVSYTAGGSVSRAAALNVDLGSTVGNIGIEGISYDPRNGRFVTVKERSPQAVDEHTITFGAPGAATTTALFTPALGVLDLSDIQVLATVPGLLGGMDEDHLLIYSQESALLLEVNRSGAILSSFDFAALASDAEGVTIDFDGNIYVVAETGPTLFVLSPTPVPLPPAILLGATGLAALVGQAAARRSPRSSLRLRA